MLNITFKDILLIILSWMVCGMLTYCWSKKLLVVQICKKIASSVKEYKFSSHIRQSSFYQLKNFFLLLIATIRWLSIGADIEKLKNISTSTQKLLVHIAIEFLAVIFPFFLLVLFLFMNDLIHYWIIVASQTAHKIGQSELIILAELEKLSLIITCISILLAISSMAWVIAFMRKLYNIFYDENQAKIAQYEEKYAELEAKIQILRKTLKLPPMSEGV